MLAGYYGDLAPLDPRTMEHPEKWRAWKWMEGKVLEGAGGREYAFDEFGNFWNGTPIEHFH